MPIWWWVATLAAAGVFGCGGALLELRRGRRTQRDWAAVGMNYGSLWPLVTGQAVIFALVGVAFANLAARWWL